jgi:hypothetical protein
MNSVFDLAKLLFENRAVQIPGVGKLELDAKVQNPADAATGVTLVIDGVRHDFEGGPDAWGAVCAALVELTEPNQAAIGTAADRNGTEGDSR